MATLNLQVDGSVVQNDADESDDGLTFEPSPAVLKGDAHADAANRYNTGWVFDSVTIGQGDTINTATLDVYLPNEYNDVANADLGCEDVDDAADFDTTGDVTTRIASMTTARTNFAGVDLGGVGWASAGAGALNVQSAVQEVIDRPGWASGQSLCVLWDADSDDTNIFRTTGYDGDSALAAKLAIDYTPGAAGGARHRHMLGSGILS